MLNIINHGRGTATFTTLSGVIYTCASNNANSEKWTDWNRATKNSDIYRSDQALATYELSMSWLEANVDVYRGHNAFFVLTGQASSGTFYDGNLYLVIVGNNNVSFAKPLCDTSSGIKITSVAFNSETVELTINLSSASRLLVVPLY